MPYKDYREYKDWAEETITDSEEIEMMKLKSFNDPASQKSFHDNLTKHSKLKGSQPSEILAKVYGVLTFSNFLSLDETKIKPQIFINKKRQSLSARGESLQIVDDDIILNEPFDPEAYTNRAVFKKKTRLIDVGKTRSEMKRARKDRSKDNMSYLIIAFQQYFNKIQPKPIDFTSRFLTMVNKTFFDYLNIQIFRFQL